MPPVAKKHLPFNAWPAEDRAVWTAAFEPDIFEDDRTSHLVVPTVVGLRTSYARYLGFLAKHDAPRLAWDPQARVDRGSIQAFVAHLRESCRGVRSG